MGLVARSVRARDRRRRGLGSAESALADDGAAEQHEGQVRFGVAFIARAQAAQVVQPGECALDDPARAAHARAMFAAAPGDHRLDAALAQLAAVLVVVIAAIGEHSFGALTRPTDLAADRPD